MELLIEEFFARVLYRKTCSIAMQTMRCIKYLLFYEVIFDEKRNIVRIHPQMHMTSSEFVSPYKTKSTTNDMH